MFHMTDLYVTTTNPSLGLWITSFAFALVWTPNGETSQPASQPVSWQVSQLWHWTKQTAKKSWKRGSGKP